MALSSKAVTVFATLEALRDNQADIRYPLATMFEPDLATFNGEVFDPSKLAAKINSEYHLGVNSDVIEDFAPIFQERGWLEKVTQDDRRSAFIVKCSPRNDIPDERSAFEDQAVKIASEFREFIKQISPLSQVNKSDAEIIDDLVEWLMLLDRAGDTDIRRASSSYRIGKKIVLDIPDKIEGGAPSEATFLSARFVNFLFESDSDHVEFLIELSEVGLVTEVIRDFQRPSSAVEKSDIAIYLDAPLAMDFLGLSGAPQQASVKQILGQVVSGGGSLRIFRDSVSEMQTSLHAILNRHPADRTGPTADAMRRREVLEQFVRQVAAQPERFLKIAGVAILDEDISMYPNRHRFFTKDAYEHLYSQINWVREDAARHHDASIATLAFRKREGHRSSDIFHSKHIVITRNPGFPRLARSVALEHHFISKNHVGPVIHTRQLATAVWLRMGIADRKEIPRSYILSACRRVLTLRKNIVEKVSHFKENLSEDQAAQLEVLMSSDRSTQVLMDKTLGSAAVIDSSNIEILLDEMRKAQIADYAQERDAELEAVTGEARRREEQLAGSLAESAKEIERRELEIAARDATLVEERRRLREIKLMAIERTNRAMGRLRAFSLAVIALVFLLVTALSALSGAIAESAGLIVAAVIVAVAALLQLVSTYRDKIVDPFLKKRDFYLLEKTCLEFGLNYDDLIEEVSHEGNRFLFINCERSLN